MKKTKEYETLYNGPDPKLKNSEYTKLHDLHDKFRGERIFVMGNGPSLNKMDLSLLEGDNVFALNRCSLLFDRIKWRPKFYCAFDLTVIPDNLDEFNDLKIEYKFFSTKHKKEQYSKRIITIFIMIIVVTIISLKSFKPILENKLI